MAYSTAAQVNRLLGPHATTASTPVTTTELEAIAGDVSRRIDAVLRNAGVLTIPVTDASFSAYLGVVESYGVTAQVLKALFPEAMGPGEQPAFAFWQALFNAAMGYDSAKHGLAQRVGIPSTLFSVELVSSYFTEHTEEEAELGDLEGAHLFSVDAQDVRPW